MTLQSRVRFRSDRTNGVTIGCAVIGSYHIIQYLHSFSFEFCQADKVSGVRFNIRNTQVHLNKAFLPKLAWRLAFCSDDNSFGSDFTIGDISLLVNFYPKSLTVLIENVSYVGSYYHPSASIRWCSSFTTFPNWGVSTKAHNLLNF